MPEQVPFIGREDEIAEIQNLIENWGNRQVICIYGDGGIGKTRLVQEIHKWYLQSEHQIISEKSEGQTGQSQGLQIEKQSIQATGIIDFDDPSLRNPENMNRKIANMLDQEAFKDFFQAQMDYHKIRAAGVSSERLNQERLAVNQIFTDRFNTVSNKKRVLLFLDTTDHLEEGKGVWQDLERKILQLRNAVILLAGRNANEIGESLQSNIDNHVEIIELEPLSKKDRQTYLAQKQEQKHITIEPDLAEKLLFLSGGRPILLDLAVEWRARGISLEWLVKESLEKIQSLDKEEKEKRQQDFEQHLVSHIKDLRSPMDQLILLMSYVYPLNTEMISQFLKEEISLELFNEAASYVFVKQLPNGYLCLHDETKRLVDKYVWPEIDPEYARRHWYSEVTVTYLSNEITCLTENIEKFEKELVEFEKEDKYSENILKVSLQLENLEQQLWQFKEQQLVHALFANLDKGIQLFVKFFDEATKTSRFTFRQNLFEKLQLHAEKFSPEQLYIRDIHKVKLCSDRGEYEEAKELSEAILKRKDISLEHQIETLILLGNVKIRLGLVEESIANFKKAVEISKANEFVYKLLKRWRRFWSSENHIREIVTALKKAINIRKPKEFFYRFFSQILYHPRETLDLLTTIKTEVFTGGHDSLAVWRVKANNALGYAYRQIGALDHAEKYYREARRKCLLEGGPDRKELQDDYGWISNNLAFVLSDSNKTRRTAIDIATSTLEHWQSIGNHIGLGAGYLVLGIAYYRSNIYEPALDAFQHALDIFTPLKHKDWLGQIYSWRGALYQDLGRLDDARRDLEESLEIGAKNIEAMTLNRLGRVYMSRENWDLAEEKMKESLKRAQQIPDYVYWLGSIARLAFIATEKSEYHRLHEFNQMLQDFLNNVEYPERNSLGMAYIGLGKLAFGQNDPHKVETIVDFFKKGITLVTEFGSYSRTDVLSRLELVEKDFHKINPQIIRSVGDTLREYVSEKEKENIAFSTVTPKMYNWANWKEEKKTDE